MRYIVAGLVGLAFANPVIAVDSVCSTPRDGIAVEIGDAGEPKRIELNGVSAMHEADVLVKVRSDTLTLDRTAITQHARKLTDGSTTSSGRFHGDNGVIYWLSQSGMVQGTSFHVTHWTFSSAKPFGEVAFGVYADIDIGHYASRNSLIVGGVGHPHRLVVTAGAQSSEGVALGLRYLRNASAIGWMADLTAYYANYGHVLDAAILTGADAGWGTFTPNQTYYPGAQGYGPADMAPVIGLALNPAAKLASFETVIAGAPKGYIN